MLCCSRNMSSECYSPQDLSALSGKGTTYELVELLGEGSFGCTYKAKLGKGFVAIKMINLTKVGKRGWRQEDITRELTNIDSISSKTNCSPFISCFYDDFTGKINDMDFLFVVMEYIQGVTLEKLLNSVDKLPINDKLKLTLQLVQGLTYIHGNGIAHGDIKPDNIMIDTVSGSIKYIDFGFSCSRRESYNPRECSVISGAEGYRPPEWVYIKADNLPFPLRTSHDVWSLGVVLYQLWNNGRWPFYGKSVETLRVYPSQSGYSLIDNIINKMMLVKGLADENTVRGYGVFRLSRRVLDDLSAAPYRADACTINDILRYTTVCKEGDVQKIKELAEVFGVPIEQFTKESMCKKIGEYVRKTHKLNMCRENLVVLANYLQLDATLPPASLEIEIHNKASLIDTSTVLNTTTTLLEAVNTITKAKMEGKYEVANDLLESTKEFVNVVVLTGPNVVDFELIRSEYIRSTELEGRYGELGNKEMVEFEFIKANLLHDILMMSN